MIVKRQSRPLPGTRLAASRERRHWPSQSRQFWAEVARYADQDRALGWPVKTFHPAPKTVRVPYSRDYVECVCGASDKDDCCCIRETMRSNMATAASGVALSSKTA